MKTHKIDEASEEMSFVKEDKGMWWKQAIVLSVFSIILAAVFRYYDRYGDGLEVFIIGLKLLLFSSAILVFFTWLFKIMTRKIKPFPWIVVAIALLLYPLQFLYRPSLFAFLLSLFGSIWAVAELFVCRLQRFKVLPYVLIAICSVLLVWEFHDLHNNLSNTQDITIGILTAIPLVTLCIVLLLKKHQLNKRTTSN